MRPHVRRILLLRPVRPPNRFFTQLQRSRPQLPFLSQPKRQVRFLTTDRKQWIKGELQRAGKYTAVVWTASVLLFTIAFGVQQEWLDRKFPSPHEWSWVTRKNYRSARWNEDHGDEETSGLVDWALTGGAYRDLLKRLEDPAIDGVGLEEQDEGGIFVAGIGKTGYDITKKPEAWRRGYCDVLMGAARAAEHLDGWVRDRTRNKAFPANVVVGPSNPSPRPVPPGAVSAPKEENCEPAFEPPETYYMRILTTNGFTEKQRLDAALGYAAWLDYKGTPAAAEDMYHWAIDIATSSHPNTSSLFDPKINALNSTAGPLSSNILSAFTALAVHQAQNANLSLALPLFLSLLRARRTLPDKTPSMLSTLSDIADSDDDKSPHLFNSLRNLITSTLSPPKYPPPPPTGTAPPLRDAQARCEEAALMLYIGEILYASPLPSSSFSPSSSSSREEGLAWTREAVDLAEEELRSRPRPALPREARGTCRQCLETGLRNWSLMVGKLAREERERREGGGGVAGHLLPSSGWFSGWLGGGDGQGADARKAAAAGKVRGNEGDRPLGPGRWESEEGVVKERVRRAKDVLLSKTDGSGGVGLFI